MAAVVIAFGVVAVDANADEAGESQGATVAAEFDDGLWHSVDVNATHIQFNVAGDFMGIDADLGAIGITGADIAAHQTDADISEMEADFQKASNAIESSTGWDIDDPIQRQRMNDEAQNFLTLWNEEQLADMNSDSGESALTEEEEASLGKMPEVLDELTAPNATCRERCLTYGYRSFVLATVLTTIGIVFTTGLVPVTAGAVGVGVAIAAVTFLITQAWGAYTTMRKENAALRASNRQGAELVALRISSAAAAALVDQLGARVQDLEAQVADMANRMAAASGSRPGGASDMRP